MGVKLQDLINRIPMEGNLGTARDIYNMSREEGGLKRAGTDWIVNRAIPNDMSAVRDLYNMSRGGDGLKGGLINLGIGAIIRPLEKMFTGMGLRPKQDIPQSPGGLLSLVRAAQKMPDYPNMRLDASAMPESEGWRPPTLPPSYYKLRMEDDE